MKARLIGCATLLALLAACGDRMGDYPSLMPTDQLLAEPTLPSHARDAADDPDLTGLQARTAQMAGRSGGSPVNDSTLDQRADALRARAGALSKTSLDGCPEGDNSCAAPAGAADNDEQP